MGRSWEVALCALTCPPSTNNSVNINVICAIWSLRHTERWWNISLVIRRHVRLIAIYARPGITVTNICGNTLNVFMGLCIREQTFARFVAWKIGSIWKRGSERYRINIIRKVIRDEICHNFWIKCVWKLRKLCELLWVTPNQLRQKQVFWFAK